MKKMVLICILSLNCCFMRTLDIDETDIHEVEISSPYILQITMPGYRATYEVPTSMIEQIRGKIKELHNKRHLYGQDVEVLLIVLQPNDSSRITSTRFSSMFLDDLVKDLKQIRNGSYF